MKKRFQDSGLSKITPAVATVAVGLGLAGVAHALTTIEDKTVIDDQAVTLCSQYVAAVNDFIDKVEDTDLFDETVPSLKVIRYIAEVEAKAFQHIRNPICARIPQKLIELKYLCISMVQNSIQLTSWSTKSNKLCSPMDLWEECNEFVFNLIFSENSIMFSKELKPGHQKTLIKIGDDINLLVEALYDEYVDTMMSLDTHADQASFAETMKKCNLTVRFIRKLALMDVTLPFLHKTKISPTYLCSAVLKAARFSAHQKMREYCCETGESMKELSNKLSEQMDSAMASGDKSPEEMAKELEQIANQFVNNTAQKEVKENSEKSMDVGA
jgi:hypothetical protein